jgi:Toprim domain
MTMSAHRPGAAEISAMLACRIEALARELLPGGRRQGAEWICGSVAGDGGGSMAVHLGGQKSGTWMDFATGEGGDALDLIAATLTANDLKAAYRWAHRWLGLGDLGAVAIRRAEVIEKAQADTSESSDDSRRRAVAMWMGAQPTLRDTPVAAYLAARGIDLEKIGRQPRAIRFAPHHYCAETGQRLPAMLAAITDGGGAHIATHQTWLAQDDAGIWRKAPLTVAKKIRGPFRGGSIRLARGAGARPLKDAAPGETIVIGEGIETCLSVVLACPDMRVIAAATLGNMGSVQLPDQVRSVLLLADNDDKPEARRGLRRAIDLYLAAGREVRVARSPKGKDFNDAIT